MDGLVEFVHRENLRLYTKQLAKETDETRRRRLLIRLLAAEEAEAQSSDPKALGQLIDRFSVMTLGSQSFASCARSP